MIFSLLKEIFDWAEVWAILIPLLALRKTIVGRSTLRPIILYLYLAFALNVAIMLIWKQGKLGLSLGIKNNNPIYNLLSILRFYLFSWYFISLRQPFLSTIKKILPIVFFVFLCLNFDSLMPFKFHFQENFFDSQISDRLHSIEAGLLLFYCLQFYLNLLQEERSLFLNTSSFWITTGLSVYAVVSFPIYLFYDQAINQDLPFAVDIWKILKVSFIILCLCLAKAFKQTHD